METPSRKDRYERIIRKRAGFSLAIVARRQWSNIFKPEIYVHIILIQEWSKIQIFYNLQRLYGVNRRPELKEY